MTRFCKDCVHYSDRLKPSLVTGEAREREQAICMRLVDQFIRVEDGRGNYRDEFISDSNPAVTCVQQRYGSGRDSIGVCGVEGKYWEDGKLREAQRRKEKFLELRNGEKGTDDVLSEGEGGDEAERGEGEGPTPI